MTVICQAYIEKVQQLANFYGRPMRIFKMPQLDDFIWYRDPDRDEKNSLDLLAVKTIEPEK